MTVNKVQKEIYKTDHDPTKEFDTELEALNHQLRVVIDEGICADALDKDGFIQHLKIHWKDVVESMEPRILCRICGGDPESHPSGIRCICDDGTDNGMYEGLQRRIQQLENRKGRPLDVRELTDT